MNRIIASRYEILTEIGRGGTSIVYLAKDLSLNKSWAVKQVSKSGMYQGQQIQNTVLDEANMLKTLDHPNLPRIVDIIEDSQNYYIIMDYIEGITLKEVLERQGALEQKVVLRWGKELSAVLKYLHSQEPPIIYRDMKPANIILQPNGSLKVIDFGIARTYKSGNLKDTMPLGTKGYAAPEQFASEDGTTQTDERTDIYNLGVTLYELLTDHVPSEPPYKLLPVRKFNPGLSQGIEKIIIKCTESDPEDRPQTIDEVGYALANYERLDDRFIRSQRAILKRAFIPIIVGILFCVMGTAGLFVNEVMNANKYENLILPTGSDANTEENLTKAIEIDPANPIAYKKLVELYAKDNLTEEDTSNLINIYSRNAEKLKKDPESFEEINYILGENILIFFKGQTDESIRNKVLTSLPFFEAVYEMGDTQFDKYNLACSYYNLGSFYKDYIVGDNTFVKGAAKKEYESLFENFTEAIKSLEKTNPQLRNMSAELMLNILENQKYQIASFIKKDEFEEQIYNILEIAKDKEINAYGEAMIKNLAGTYTNASKREGN